MSEELREEFQKALKEVRDTKERKFDQTVELIINLQKFDPRKNPLNLFINVPHKIKEKKIAAFLETQNKNVDTITPDQFKKLSSKIESKKLVKKYDFFLAQASVMPKVATAFGKVLGPAGKMPNPQLGIIMDVDDKTIKELKEKVNNSLKIRAKEPSIKLAVGKQSMDDKDIIENIITIHNTIEKNLPRDKENIKNIEIKLTMSKPYKIKIR